MPGSVDVVDEAAAPGEQRRIFEARDTGAEMLGAHGRMLPEQRNAAADDTPAALQCNRDRSYVAVSESSRGRLG